MPGQKSYLSFNGACFWISLGLVLVVTINLYIVMKNWLRALLSFLFSIPRNYHYLVIRDITIGKPLFSKDMGLFDHTNGDFYFLEIYRGY